MTAEESACDLITSKHSTTPFPCIVALIFITQKHLPHKKAKKKVVVSPDVDTSAFENISDYLSLVKFFIKQMSHF